jgi:hypothetical protein
VLPPSALTIDSDNIEILRQGYEALAAIELLG